MDVSHAILFLENADFVRITGLYFPAKFELYHISYTMTRVTEKAIEYYLKEANAVEALQYHLQHLKRKDDDCARSDFFGIIFSSKAKTR